MEDSSKVHQAGNTAPPAAYRPTCRQALPSDMLIRRGPACPLLI